MEDSQNIELSEMVEMLTIEKEILEETCASLREALVGIRERSASEMEAVKLDVEKKAGEELRSAREQIVELQKAVEDGAAYEAIIENLTEKNLELNSTVQNLQKSVSVMEATQELMEEIDERQRQELSDCRKELDKEQTLVVDLRLQLKALAEQIQDMQRKELEYQRSIESLKHEDSALLAKIEIVESELVLQQQRTRDLGDAKVIFSSLQESHTRLKAELAVARREGYANRARVYRLERLVEGSGMLSEESTLLNQEVILVSFASLSTLTSRSLLDRVLQSGSGRPAGVRQSDILSPAKRNDTNSTGPSFRVSSGLLELTSDALKLTCITWHACTALLNSESDPRVNFRAITDFFSSPSVQELRSKLEIISSFSSITSEHEDFVQSEHRSFRNATAQAFSLFFVNAPQIVGVYVADLDTEWSTERQRTSSQSTQSASLTLLNIVIQSSFYHHSIMAMANGYGDTRDDDTIKALENESLVMQVNLDHILNDANGIDINGRLAAAISMRNALLRIFQAVTATTVKNDRVSDTRQIYQDSVEALRADGGIGAKGKWAQLLSRVKGTGLVVANRMCMFDIVNSDETVWNLVMDSSDDDKNNSSAIARVIPLPRVWQTRVRAARDVVRMLEASGPRLEEVQSQLLRAEGDLERKQGELRAAMRRCEELEHTVSTSSLAVAGGKVAKEREEKLQKEVQVLHEAISTLEQEQERLERENRRLRRNSSGAGTLPEESIPVSYSSAPSSSSSRVDSSENSDSRYAYALRIVSSQAKALQVWRGIAAGRLASSLSPLLQVPHRAAEEEAEVAGKRNALQVYRLAREVRASIRIIKIEDKLRRKDSINGCIYKMPDSKVASASLVDEYRRLLLEKR